MTRIDDPERLRAMPAGLIDDRFELFEEAGTGGMGTVYRARDHESGGLVALKVLAPTEAACVERFARERAILAELSHPGIVGYVAAGTTPDDEPYLAMEWLEGESLAARLAREPLSWRDACEIGKQVLNALGAAHARGVIHRDLKPSNLFLVDKLIGRVVVLDFGIARLKAPSEGLTETGMIVGTPGYMAPEQARGKKDIDERADLFALGCVLYRALAGEQPFPGDDVLAILSKLAFEDPPRLKDAPPALDALVFRLLEKEPADRPANARDVEDALDRILTGETELVVTRPDKVEKARTSFPAPTPPTRKRKERDESRWPLLLIPLAFALAIAGWLAFDRGEAPETAAREPEGVPDARPMCRDWASALAEAQQPTGAFGMERHRAPMAWTTGQVLFSLSRAHRACEAPGRTPLARGADALLDYRAARWSEEPEHPAIPSIAWAALASHELGQILRDPRLVEASVEARDLLLVGQREDGSFEFVADANEESNAYSTVLALFALIELEPDAPSDAARGARERASAWLRRALVTDLGDPPLRATAGLAEQAVFVLLEARALGDRSDGDAALFTRAGQDLVSRCELANDACGRALHANGETYLDHVPGRGPNLQTFWHPWATLACDRLAESDLELPADLRRDLQAIARWGEARMEREAEGITMTPAYELSEYLFVASELHR